MKRIQGVTHLKMKRVTNSKCVNIIVFWMPRPVKVGAFFCGLTSFRTG